MVKFKKSSWMLIGLIIGILGGNFSYTEYKDWQEQVKEEQDQDVIDSAVESLDITVCEQKMNFYYNMVECVRLLVQKTEPPDCSRLTQSNMIYNCYTFNALKHDDDSICGSIPDLSGRDGCYGQFCSAGRKASCDKISSPALRSMIEGSPGSPVINLA